MTKAILTLVFLLTWASGTWAQGGGDRQQEDKACRNDVTRHCRKVMQEGDMAILACLQEQRQRLSRACRKMLEESGQ